MLTFVETYMYVRCIILLSGKYVVPIEETLKIVRINNFSLELGMAKKEFKAGPADPRGPHISITSQSEE